MCGFSNSWDQPATISGTYGPITWSPCGQSFSALSSTSVEVWDSLTLDKSFSLQFTEPDQRVLDLGGESDPSDLLAYSPDGRSLSICLGSVIIIWDIQTGGMVEEFNCRVLNALPKSLTWSLDGQSICVVFQETGGTWRVCIYDVASGTKTSTSTILSSPEPCLWPCDSSFKIMTMLSDGGTEVVVNIVEVQPMFPDNLVESFSINLNIHGARFGSVSFSPATYRVAIITGYPSPSILFAFSIQDSKVLLRDEDLFDACRLSPDGSLLVAAGRHNDTYVWKYTSDHGYTQWGKFPFWGSEDKTPRGYRFSPTLSSVLIANTTSLEVQQLEDPETAPHVEAYYHYGEFSVDGTYVINGHELGRTIVITNLHKISSQFIDTGCNVRALTLTGNVILVQGIDVLIAWRLTEEGTVEGTSGAERADYHNSMWIKPMQEGDIPEFRVEGHIGAVKCVQGIIYYNTETGEELEPTLAEALIPSSLPWKDLNCNSERYMFEDQSSLSYHRFTGHCGLSEDDLQVHIPWYEGGWVKFPVGEHQYRFWLPAYWRPGWEEEPSLEEASGWEEAHWINDIMTLRLVIPSSLVIIKF